jgi:hypothetical protein
MCCVSTANTKSRRPYVRFPIVVYIFPAIVGAVWGKVVPIPIGLVYRIVLGVGVAFGADAGERRIPVVGRDEAAEQRVEVAGVQVDEAGLGIVALADEALAGLDAAASP